MIRIGIAGCGRVARIHLSRLIARGGIEIVGLVDPDPSAAQNLADFLGIAGAEIFTDPKEMLAKTTLEALAIFAPHRTHYRLTMHALQAGIHVFIEKPLCTNSQEASDIVGLAQARGRIVAVGHQYRLRPSLVEARRRVMAGEIGSVRLITATLSDPWLARHQDKADAWRLDPRLSGGGILADSGDHVLDALLWTTGQSATEVFAFQNRHAPALDVVTAATIRLAEGTIASLAVSGICPSGLFELNYFGDLGRMRVSDSRVAIEIGAGIEESVPLPAGEATIDGDFLDAIRLGRPPCCPATEAVDTVRLLEAIARSATSGEMVRLA